MSYDIVAFDPAATTDADFPVWYESQVEWSEAHGYSDAAVTTPALRAFYRELVDAFPAMNGPDAPDYETLESEVEARLTGYSIGTAIIYASFMWPQAERAAAAFRELAARHQVAVAWVSDSSGQTPIVRPMTAASTHVLSPDNSFIGPGWTRRDFRAMFEQFDGGARSARSLAWLEPAGTFIQAAGASDRLTVEIRNEMAGVEDLFVVGKPAAAVPATEPDVVIAFGEHSTTVYEGEIFDADAAAELFFHYYEHDGVPAGYALRPLGFS